MPIVQTAYHGYNASLFAYGQTSSGKSFSMMGVRGTALVGLIPRIAHLLFHTITVRQLSRNSRGAAYFDNQKKTLVGNGRCTLLTLLSSLPLGQVDKEKEFFVEGSYLEIYNEKLRDLLDSKGTDDLKVRAEPSRLRRMVRFGVRVRAGARVRVRRRSPLRSVPTRRLRLRTPSSGSTGCQ